MLSPNLAAKIATAAVLAALVVLPACSINVKDKNKEGQSSLDIKSPIGDLHVDEQPDIRDAGLTVYPGARPAPKENGEDKKSANVNLSFPGFALKVVAAEFASDDPSDKVLAYYNKELQKYGKPIQCHGNWNGGHVNYKGNDDSSRPVSCGNDGSVANNLRNNLENNLRNNLENNLRNNLGDAVELKVGTEGNQHVVAIKPDGKGSRFALVYVRARTGKDDTI
jgi:hypothetical protein